MCWIFAYIWNKKATDYLINWLKSLEYRWYDSAWLALLNEKSEVYINKAIWRVSNLWTKIEKDKKILKDFNIWIAHTRWATHWWVNENNTHPHYSSNKRFYLVHNWIIENFIELKKDLQKKWYSFYSDTDSEIIAKLIEDNFTNSLEETIKIITKKITWAYALVVMDKNNPNSLIWIKKWSPMVVAFREWEYFISSDINAISNISNKYIPLEDNEMVIVSKNWYKIYSAWEVVEKEVYNSEKNDYTEELWNFNHFMEKEIFEIPEVIENGIRWRINFDSKEIKSNSLDSLKDKDIQRIEIIASGTSYNAWYIWAYLFEELSQIPTSVFISSEFKYKKNFINKNTLYIFISQSWETADTLECLKIVKNKWWLTFWVVNVVGSSIARMCDLWLYTHSWVEVWVAATKSFIWQLLALIIMSLYLWNKRSLDYTTFTKLLEDIKSLKNIISETLLNKDNIKLVAKKYSKSKNMFFLWRNVFFPLAMEWSLKCKEITYNHTESYSAWELKHWPLSLIDENFPTVLLNPESKLYDKNISTLKEITARGWKVIGFISKWDKNSDLYSDIIEVPKSDSDIVNLFTISVSLQLFSYYMALDLWREIDKPRNLAKSVTVE